MRVIYFMSITLNEVNVIGFPATGRSIDLECGDVGGGKNRNVRTHSKMYRPYNIYYYDVNFIHIYIHVFPSAMTSKQTTIKAINAI